MSRSASIVVLLLAAAVASVCCGVQAARPVGTSLLPHVKEVSFKTGGGRVTSVARSCIVELPSGSSVQPDSETGLVHVTLHNGTKHVYPPCNYLQSSTPQSAAPWGKWAEHVWFGVDWAYFTGSPLKADVLDFSATATVPQAPSNTQGNPKAPWTGEPVLSFWIGVQSFSYDVLQPVLAFNTFAPTGFSLASWNCCPSGYAFHSKPIVSGLSPGTSWFGSIDKIGAGDSHNYQILSTVAGMTTSLTADMSTHAGWSPRWAEAIIESYYITSCDQYIPNALLFTNVTMVTTEGKQQPSSIPWVDNSCISTAGSSYCNCGAKASSTGGDGDIQIQFTQA